MSRLEELRAKIGELREQVQSEVRVAFTETAKEVFENHPDLKLFSWAQYTPYFNDGEPCEFSARKDELERLVIGESEYTRVSKSYKHPGTFYFDEGPEGVETLDSPAAEAALQFIAQFEDDELREMFGDHVEVVVTPSGVETEEYSHN